MEIILALMLLGASPFGAAMLNKPTRTRFVKFATAHNPLRKEDPEFPVLEPRNKNREAETKLAEMWQEAFTFFLIPNAESKLRWALEKKKSFMDVYVKEQEQMTILDQRHKDFMRRGLYIGFRDRQVLTDRKNNLQRLVAKYNQGLDKDEKFLLGLVEKYGTEIRYNQDLIYTTAKRQSEFRTFDFAALAVYASK